MASVVVFRNCLHSQSRGIYFVCGKLYFGTTDQTAITYFKDTNQVIVYSGFPVNVNFYEIVLAGAGSYATTFQLGNYSGGVTSGGVSIKGANRYTHYGGVATGLVPSVWKITADAVNTLCNLYGCTFSEMLSAAFRSDSAIRFCTFQNFGTITPNGATLDSCTFLDLRTTSPISASYAISVATTTPVLTNNTYINCATAIKWDRAADTNVKLDGSSFITGGSGHAIEFGTNTPGDPTELTFTNITFSTGYGGTPGSNLISNSGSTDACIYNNSEKHLIINISGGTTPSVRNGTNATTTISSSVPVTITVKDASGTGILNAQAAVYKTSDNSQIMNMDTSAGGIATIGYTGTTPADIYYRIRKTSSGDTKYETLSGIGTISISGMAVTVTLTEDEIA